ncbi:MAG: hypothetical protein JWQ73_2731 [Variovorax sp.]|nr:hypothetical protein [Variovorax sp.]
MKIARRLRGLANRLSAVLALKKSRATTHECNPLACPAGSKKIKKVVRFFGDFIGIPLAATFVVGTAYGFLDAIAWVMHGVAPANAFAALTLAAFGFVAGWLTREADKRDLAGRPLAWPHCAATVAFLAVLLGVNRSLFAEKSILFEATPMIAVALILWCLIVLIPWLSSSRETARKPAPVLDAPIAQSERMLLDDLDPALLRDAERR